MRYNEDRLRLETETRGRSSDIFLMLLLDEIRVLNGHMEQLLRSHKPILGHENINEDLEVKDYEKMGRADLLKHISGLIKSGKAKDVFPKTWATMKTVELKKLLKGV